MISSFTGPNEYLIDNELKNSINKFIDENGEISIEQFDGTENSFESIFESITNLSFLSPNKLVVVRRASNNKQFIEEFTELINKIPDTTELLIIEPNIDKRLSYYKNLKKLTNFKYFENLEFGDLARWVENYTKSIGGNIKVTDARYLVEITGMNQLRLSNEIIKLVNFKPNITSETINTLVEPVSESTIFQLLDAAFSGNSKELLKIYDDQKSQKVEPQQIVAMLTWQIHILALIKTAGNISPTEIASKSKISPYVVNKSVGIAKKLSLNEIKTLTKNLLELDIKLKNQTIDIDDALLQLLLNISK